MQQYRNLLYISHGTTDETEGLKQALSLARNNNAPLKVLVITPSFPNDFPDYQKKYEEALLAQVEDSIRQSKETIRLGDQDINLTIELLANDKPTIRIIQYAIEHDHDLLIKEAEPREGAGGFKAIDMELLRKCPCPVWLCRPIKHSREHIQVAVAIDPEAEEQSAIQLSEQLLKTSGTLADSCSGELHIVSCWDYALESELRNNVFIKIPKEEIQEKVDHAKNRHRSELDALIEQSGIAGNQAVHHLRGKPEEQIPAFVNNHNIDILVMGTVARTGIPGFLTGNTAENIMQQLPCSLMALKPIGFESPVKVKK